MQGDSPQTEVWTAVATTKKRSAVLGSSPPQDARSAVEEQLRGTSLLYERLRQRVMPPARLPFCCPYP